MGTSEFEEAYDDDPGRLAQEREDLGAAILEATIRDLEPKQPAVLSEQGTIRAAVDLMLEQKLNAIVVQRDSKPLGIFTERDLMRRVVAAGIDLDRSIEEVMTPDPETLGLDDGIAFALNRMAVGGYRNVPIVDESGKLMGVISLKEVVHYIVSVLPSHVINLPPVPDLEARDEHGG